MTHRLDALLEAGWLEQADLLLADRLLALAGAEPRPDARLLVALTSAGLRQGHVCLDLRHHPALEELETSAGLAHLEAAGLLAPGAPLVLENGRLYLARYHHWEQQVLAMVRERLAAPPPPFDADTLRRDLAGLFPGREAVDWQRVAVALALTRRLCVISGGPGTGKTWTAARILELARRQPGGEGLRIALAAPTGKAAGRLGGAIAEAGVTGLPEALTLHRLLEMRPGRVRPRRNRHRPLPFDLVVVDEVSMVDLPLMAHLAEALPPEARLILLGDRDQLASVEAGQVMADLCGPDQAGYGAETARLVAAIAGDKLAMAEGLPPMADHRVILRASRRFDPERGIGRLARAVNAGDLDAALAALHEESEVSLETPEPARLGELLHQELLPLVQAARRAASPAEALDQLNRARVLCALRDGPQGVARLNREMERLLGVEGRAFYAGRPLMITVNDHRLRLYNGDTGLVLADPRGRLQAHFPDPDHPGRVRTFAPARLPPHETAFALTIHKSQGSEFDRVILVLPRTDNPVLGRELVYTGLTRARRAVTLCATQEILGAALARRVQRASGLREALWA